MRFSKFVLIVATASFLLSGCSFFERLVYRPDINQGNYLAPTQVAQVQKGMTREQVVYLLGSPMLQDPFGSNTWYYVFRQQPGHEDVTQQTLTLRFDENGTLISIKNEEPYPPQ